MYTEEELKKIIDIGIDRNIIVFDIEASGQFTKRLLRLMIVFWNSNSHTKNHTFNAILDYSCAGLYEISNITFQHLNGELVKYYENRHYSYPYGKSNLVILVKADIPVYSMVPTDVVLGAY